MSAWRRRCWSQQTASQRWSQDNLGAKTLMYMSHVYGARRCCMYFSFASKACFEIFSCETLEPQRPVQQWAGNAACFFETTRHTPLAKHMEHIVEMAHQIRPKFSFCCECCRNMWILETQAICLPVYIVYRSRLSPTSGSTRTCLIWRGIVKDAASPLHELAILPNALPLEAFGCLRDCISVLLRVLPLAAVGSSIWPSQCPFAMFPAIHKLANIGTAIRPPHLALGRHCIVGPLAWIAAPIAPCVHTLSMHVIVVKLAFVSTQCRPNKLAPSMFCSSLELTFEDRTICPFFFAMALLHIIHPLSGVFCTGRMIVDSLPFLLVILELANIFCSILPNQYSMTVLLTWAMRLHRSHCLERPLKPRHHRQHQLRWQRLPLRFRRLPWWFGCSRRDRDRSCTAIGPWVMQLWLPRQNVRVYVPRRFMTGRLLMLQCIHIYMLCVYIIIDASFSGACRIATLTEEKTLANGILGRPTKWQECGLLNVQPTSVYVKQLFRMSGYHHRVMLLSSIQACSP